MLSKRFVVVQLTLLAGFGVLEFGIQSLDLPATLPSEQQPVLAVGVLAGMQIFTLLVAVGIAVGEVVVWFRARATLIREAA